MLRPTPKYRTGDRAVCTYGVHPPTGACIPAESTVTVMDVSCAKHGRGRADWSEPRYLVRWAGVQLWTYESALADAREGMEE